MVEKTGKEKRRNVFLIIVEFIIIAILVAVLIIYSESIHPLISFFLGIIFLIVDIILYDYYGSGIIFKFINYIKG